MAAFPDIVAPAALDALIGIASRAAAAILSVKDLNQRQKADLSPVTAADLASQTVIIEELGRLWPAVPVLSEEAPDRHARALAASLFVAVDPLDGTREFLAGRDEYAVNIAVIDRGVPVAGVIAAPARGLIWGGHVARGAERLALQPGSGLDSARERMPIRTRPRPASPCVVMSRSHLDAATVAYIDRLPQPSRAASGSSLKFCLVAEGSADIYPRMSPVSVWDVAAGHALVVAAGGTVIAPDGVALRYGSNGTVVPAFIAAGDGRNLPTI